MMTSVSVMQHEWRKLQTFVLICARCGWCVPYFYESSYSNSKMMPRRRERQGGNVLLEGEMVKNESAGEVCKNSVAILIDGKEQISAGIEGKARDITAM